MDFYRRVVSGRVAEMAGPEGLPIDRLMRDARHPPRRRARGGGARPGAARASSSASAPASTPPPPSAKAPPFEMQLLRPRFEPWRPVDILSLGKLLAFGLSTNWERELLRADMLRELGPELAARLDPTYPADNPVVTQEAWSGDGLAIVEQIDAVRRSMGLAAEASGSNNWAVSGARSRDRLAADRRRPAPAPEHAGHLVRGRACATATASSAAPRCRGCPGVYMGQNNDVCWTFTNVMADVQDLFVERVEGDTLPVRGRVAAAGDACARRSRSRAARAGRARGAQHPPRPDRQRGARRRRGRAAGAALADARRTDRLRRHVRAARDRLRPGPGAPGWRATPRRPRT